MGAYEQGKDAYFSGEMVVECPFTFNSEEYHLWRQGWYDEQACHMDIIYT